MPKNNVFLSNDYKVHFILTACHVILCVMFFFFYFANEPEPYYDRYDIV